jgi:hypothetical protein
MALGGLLRFSAVEASFNPSLNVAVHTDPEKALAKTVVGFSSS